MNRLCDRTVGNLPTAVRIPGYNRSAILPGIVHLGVGAFHRAHQAVYTEDCLDRGARDWAILGASLRGTRTRDALQPQDGLYTVAVRNGDTECLRVVGAIRYVLATSGSPAALLDAMANPAIRIVSLTVTENGYTIDPTTGSLDEVDPGIIHDLVHPDEPMTMLGVLAAALRRRRAEGSAPFTVLSCDNLHRNGATLHAALTQFAWLLDKGFGRFVESEISCPSSMVDRIVPATTDADRLRIGRALGCTDAWPLTTEPFCRWVLEDRFPTGRPAWHEVGATMVADVTAHERMKLRLLNGAHTILAAIGLVVGLKTVSDVVSEPSIVVFLDKYWSEVAETLGVALDTRGFRTDLLSRFMNRALDHQLKQIATDGSLKLTTRVLLPLRERWQQNLGSPFITFAVAAWIVSTRGCNEQGLPCVIADAGLASLVDATPEGLLQNRLDAVGLSRDAVQHGVDAHALLRDPLDAILRLGMRTALSNHLMTSHQQGR